MYVAQEQTVSPITPRLDAQTRAVIVEALATAICRELDSSRDALAPTSGNGRQLPKSPSVERAQR